MARTLALALALVATDAFIPGTTLRQRVAPVRMVADYLSTMSPSATGTKPKGDYLSSAPTTAPGALGLSYQDTKKAVLPTADSQSTPLLVALPSPPPLPSTRREAGPVARGWSTCCPRS